MNFIDAMIASYLGSFAALVTLALPLGYLVKQKLSNSLLGGLT